MISLPDKAKPTLQELQGNMLAALWVGDNGQGAQVHNTAQAEVTVISCGLFPFFFVLFCLAELIRLFVLKGGSESCSPQPNKSTSFLCFDTKIL